MSLKVNKEVNENHSGEAKRFFRSGILLTLVGLAMRTAVMLFGAFISRTVGAEGTGLYTLVMTVYSFAVTFATSGISLTVTRLVASAVGEGKTEQVGRVLRGAFIYSFAFGLVATLGLFFGADFIGERILSDVRTVTSLRLLSISLLPAALSAVFAGYFVGVKRVAFNAVATVFCQAVKMAITIALVFRLAPYGTVEAVVGLCLGIVLTEIFGFLVIFIEYIYDRRKHSEKSKTKSPEISSVARTALPLAFSAYIRSLLLNVEHIMIPKKLRESGESQSEAYSHYGTLHGMALPLITYPMSPLSSFAGLLVPEFAEDMAAKKQNRMSKIATKALNSTIAYASVIAIFILFFAEELGYMVYNSYEAGYYISVLAPVLPIMYLDHVTDSILKGIGEQVFSMWVNITDSLLSVFLVWLLIPKMGIMGYAVVIVVMESYNFLLSFLRLKRKINFKILPSYFIIPLISAVISASITKPLFSFAGRGVNVIWIVLKMIFALAICLFLLSIFEIIGNNLNKKSKIKSPPTTEKQS